MKWTYKEKLPAGHELLEYGDLLAQILFNRSITSSHEAEKYLHPSLNDIPDSGLLPNAKKVAKGILKAIKEHQKIYIYGDYDVDGISSTAILFDFLYRELKANVIPYIPNRFDEGYGLNKKAIQHIKSEGATLIITVDCGIRDSELVNEFADENLQFIITDHHEIPSEGIYFNNYVTVVHPGLANSKYPVKSICAANVVWKIVCELVKKSKIKFDPMHYIDLVALATVCDVMPLIGENRAIVKYGLDALKISPNRGLSEILTRNYLDLKKLDAYHFGFVIGPRLNAAGRMEDAITGLKLLTSRDNKVITVLAEKLESLNRERQVLTIKYLEEAVLQAETQIKKGQVLIFVVGKKWSEGIIGLVAGKLNEKYNLPVIAVSDDSKQIKGSARSVKGFNITNAISQYAEMLERYGGHSQAAGFTVKKGFLNKFKNSIQRYTKKEIDIKSMEKMIEIDNDINEEDIDLSLAYRLFEFKPFGFGNPTPIFRLHNIKVSKIFRMGKERQHIKMFGLTEKGKQIEAIAFNRPDYIDIMSETKQIDMVCTVDVNVWNGEETLQFNIKDVKSSNEE